jgi:hypothetical protein
VFVFGGVRPGASILVGGSGRDWFVTSLFSIVVNWKWGEIVTTPIFDGVVRWPFEFSFRKFRR